MKQLLALSVGINDYPGTGQDLSGCVNDALDVTSELKARGFVVTTLLNEQATKANVVRDLTNMLSLLKRGDEAVFHYSGHGTGIWDKDGDEADGRDEALVLYDFRNGGLLVDDELALVMDQRVRGTHVLTLSDSCHSGTMLRALGTETARRRYDARPKYLHPNLVGATPRSTPVSVAQTRPMSGAAMISGCADGEYSYDTSFYGRPNGAFTYTALNALNTQRPRNLHAWHKAIRTTLPSNDLPQTPQLTAGPWSKRRTMPL